MDSSISSAISQLRFIALVCILLHHSFCIYLGWPPNLSVNLGMPEHYLLVSRICKGCGLVTFCFISGMLTFYSFDNKDYYPSTIQKCINFMGKKSRRLLLPSLIWGLIYLVFFKKYLLTQYYPSFVNGTHLWFLPMLFLLMVCFTPILFSQKLWLVPCSIFVFFLFIPPIRTTVEFINYFPAFFCGYIYMPIISKNRYTGKFKPILLISAIVILVYSSLSYFNESILLYGVFTSCVIILLTVFKTHHKFFHTIFNYKFIKIAIQNSFPIYILHQFVIILFSFFEIPFLTDCSILGILIYFMVAFIVSLGLSYAHNLIKKRYGVLEYVF